MTHVAATPSPKEVPQAQRPGLRSRVISAGMWSLANYGCSQVIRIGSSMVLTRLLMPEAYGLYSLVATYTMGIAMFTDMGLGQYLFQSKRAHEPSFADSVWTLAVVRGVVIWLIAVGLAWPMAAFYNQPVLRPLLVVASCNLMIGALQSANLVMANRALNQRVLTIFAITHQVVGVTFQVLLAWWLRSVWALVLAGVVAEAIRCALSHCMIPGPRSHWRWDSAVARELRGFSGWIYASSILGFFGTQADRLVLGKAVSIEMLGIYGLATSLALVPTQLFERGASLMAPVLVQIREGHRHEVQGKLHEMRSVLLRAGVVLVTVTSVGAPAFFGLLYDARYTNAAVFAALLSVSVFATLLQRSLGGILLAFGDARAFTAVCAARFGGTLVGSMLGLYLGGTSGFTLGLSLGGLLAYVANLGLIRRHGISLGRGDFGHVARCAVACGFGWAVNWMLVSDCVGWSPVLASAASTVLCAMLLLGMDWRIVMGGVRRASNRWGHTTRALRAV